MSHDEGPAESPIPLSAAMLEAIRTWAADDRLWGSRSATVFNLCTFARLILKINIQESKPHFAEGE